MPPNSTRIPIQLVLLAATVALLATTGCNVSVRNYKIASDSMSPLLRDGDGIIVDESVDARGNLHDGDVIAFRRDNAVLIKRILAMPGESIGGIDGKVIRDGKQLKEPYLAPPVNDAALSARTFAGRRINDGELFVMGDNRDDSLDSRFPDYAPVKISDVVGKYSFTYFHAAAK